MVIKEKWWGQKRENVSVGGWERRVPNLTEPNLLYCWEGSESIIIIIIIHHHHVRGCGGGTHPPHASSHRPSFSLLISYHPFLFIYLLLLHIYRNIIYLFIIFHFDFSLFQSINKLNKSYLHIAKEKKKKRHFFFLSFGFLFVLKYYTFNFNS